MSETGPSIDPSGDPAAPVATPPQKKPGWFRRNILGVREEAPTGTEAEPAEEPEPTPEPILSDDEIAALEAEAGGDDEKLKSLIREAYFMKEVGRLAGRSEDELNELNPYKETAGYKKEKFKSSLRRRAVIKAIITGVVGTVGVGVAVATGGSALPVILGVAGKALGLGAMASFGAATAVDAKQILYDTDTNKERMAAIYAGRQRRMRDLARRVEETARKGFLTEADGTIVNLAEAKGDLFSYVMKIDSPDQLEEGVDDEIIKENQEIAQLKEKMVASRKHQRNMKIGASLLAGVLVGGTELLHNMKELAHNIEAHGFEMHGAGLGAIVDRIREFQQDFVDVHHHFTQSVVTDSAGHTEAVFHTSQATHDAIHTAMDRDVDALGYPIDINDTYNGVYGDFRLPGVGHGGPWLHEVGDTMQQAFEKQAMEYANIVAAGELATCAVADGISEWAAHELSQKRFSTLEANRERRADESFGVPGGAEEVFASVDHEMREKMGIGKELELKPDKIDIDQSGKKGKPGPTTTYTKARNRFVLTARQGDTYTVTPLTMLYTPIGDPAIDFSFDLDADQFEAFFTFKTNAPKPAIATPASALSGGTTDTEAEDESAAAEDPVATGPARPRPAAPPPPSSGLGLVDILGVDGAGAPPPPVEEPDDSAEPKPLAELDETETEALLTNLTECLSRGDIQIKRDGSGGLFVVHPDGYTNVMGKREASFITGDIERLPWGCTGKAKLSPGGVTMTPGKTLRVSLETVGVDARSINRLEQAGSFLPRNAAFDESKFIGDVENGGVVVRTTLNKFFLVTAEDKGVLFADQVEVTPGGAVDYFLQSGAHRKFANVKEFVADKKFSGEGDNAELCSDWYVSNESHGEDGLGGGGALDQAAIDALFGDDGTIPPAEPGDGSAPEEPAPAAEPAPDEPAEIVNIEVRETRRRINEILQNTDSSEIFVRLLAEKYRNRRILNLDGTQTGIHVRDAVVADGSILFNCSDGSQRNLDRWLENERVRSEIDEKFAETERLVVIKRVLESEGLEQKGVLTEDTVGIMKEAVRRGSRVAIVTSDGRTLHEVANIDPNGLIEMTVTVDNLSDSNTHLGKKYHLTEPGDLTLGMVWWEKPATPTPPSAPDAAAAGPDAQAADEADGGDGSADETAPSAQLDSATPERRPLEHGDWEIVPKRGREPKKLIIRPDAGGEDIELYKGVQILDDEGLPAVIELVDKRSVDGPVGIKIVDRQQPVAYTLEQAKGIKVIS